MAAPVRPSTPAAGIAAHWPWAVLGLLAVAAVADCVVWLAFRVAHLATGQGWTGPAWSLDLFLRSIRDGIAVVDPSTSPTVFWIVAGAFVVVVAAALAIPVSLVLRRLFGRRDPAHSMAKRRDLRDLTPRGAKDKARRLRRSLRGIPDWELPGNECGIALGDLLPRGPAGLRASWEDVLLAVMAPRAGKTTALAVPAILGAPGWAVATSNKSDVWEATSALRRSHGRIWTFDPQSIVFVEQTWWWDPISVVHDFATAHRLAGHFVQEIRGERGDRDFWSQAALDLLTSLLLAAARAERPITAVAEWLDDTANPEPAGILSTQDRSAATSLIGRQQGAPETRDGIYETARTAVQCLRDPSIMRWVTPPPTGHLEMLDVDAFVRSPDTLYLLSKDGAGAAAPLVAALTDSVMRAAVQAAERAGGRLDPPGVMVLDEAANVCRIADLPDLYSHLGSRGVAALTILQSYVQGKRVWGEHGMDTLWSAATIKMVGAGLDDLRMVEDLSRLIGEVDVDVVSTSWGDGRHSRQVSVRRQRILDASDVRALPRGRAILLATGAPVALVQLAPWFTGPDADQIAAEAAAAEAALTARAVLARRTGPTPPPPWWSRRNDS